MTPARFSAATVVVLLACAVATPGPVGAREQVAAPLHTYEVVREFPHDVEAFTQGLIYRDGFLYESTGLNGRSSLRKVRLETGEVVHRRDIDARYFAEGLTDWNDRLVQLTYRSGIAFVYDLATFEPRRTFTYRGEGWGLASDGTRLIMSDGSAELRFLDPETFAELGRVTVTDGGRPLEDLNELEVVGGAVYANVWFEDRIAVIDPSNGQVTSWIDLRGLAARMMPPPDAASGAVLNGIAYDAAGRRLFVTGKLWPRVFEIRVRA